MSTEAAATTAALLPSSPPSTRPKPRRACEECNRKKAKCDMRKPTCGPCLRTDSPCHFPSRRKKHTPRKPQLKQQSLQLSDSLSKLVQILEAASQTSGSNLSPPFMRELSRVSYQDSLRGLLSEVRVLESHNIGTSASSEPGSNITIMPQSQLHEESHQNTESWCILGTAENGTHDQEIYGCEESQRGSSESSSNPISHTEHLGPPVIVDSCSLITYPLAMELINLFFEYIQPWLPLLHKPRFLSRMEAKLKVDGDVLKGLNPDEALTICSMFALSARFSNNPRFSGVATLERGAEFAELAAHAYGKSRLSANPPFAHLQGCILLAFYFFTSGPTQQGWIVIGVCVRLAYIMSLFEIDDMEWVPPQPVEAVEKEELRRAWWLVWELDTFASTAFRKPFSIDRRRMAVKLPVSDQVWFSDGELDSREILANPSQTWKSLQGSSNQDARAWYLLANHYMSSVSDKLQQRQELTLEDKLMLENEVACFKMALPSALHLDAEVLEFSTATFPTCNWIMGIHIMLMASSFMISEVTSNESDVQTPTSGGFNSALPLRQRSIHLSRIVSRWEARYIPLSHPFWSCLIVAPCARNDDIFRAHLLIASAYELSKIVLSQFAEKWKLARTALDLLNMVEQDVSLSEDEKKLAKGYAAFFHFPPFNIATTASDIQILERSVLSTTEVSQHNQASEMPNKSQSPRHAFQLSEDLSLPASLLDQVDLTEYRAAPFDMQEFPSINANLYDEAIDTESGMSDSFSRYLKTDFMRSHPSSMGDIQIQGNFYT